MKHQWGIITLGKFMREIVREVIILTIILKMGRPTKLIIDTEAYITARTEMDGVYGIRRDTISINNDLQKVLHLVGKISIVDEIKQNSTYKYSREVIFWVN